MKPILEIFPLVVFFTAYYASDIFGATLALMISSVIQITILWSFFGQLENSQKYSFWAIMILGSLTLFFQDDMFIKWKLTIVNWLIAIIFIFGKILNKKTVLESMLGSKIKLSSNIWTKLHFSWITFFILIGTINLYVIYNFTTETWIYYKIIAVIASLIFTIAQGIYITLHMSKKNEQQNSL